MKRHQRKEKRLFWHIDYLLNNESAKVTSVYCAARQKEDERTVDSLIQAIGALPIRGFGCSDCHCKSHLFYAKSFEFLEDWLQCFKAN
jgi:Uri superfamily endonuclease